MRLVGKSKRNLTNDGREFRKPENSGNNEPWVDLGKLERLNLQLSND